MLSNFVIFVGIGIIIIIIVAIFHNSHKKTIAIDFNKKEKKVKEFGRHNIAGVTYKNLDGTSRQTILKRCVRILDGHLDRSVVFIAESEPGNTNDPNAIRVYAEETWETAKGDLKDKFLGFVGYFPREVAKEITDLITEKQGEAYVSISQPEVFSFTNEKNKDIIGISFDIAVYWYSEPEMDRPSDG